MKDLLKLILEGESLNTEQIARILQVSVADVEQGIRKLKDEGVILGWRPVLNLEKAADQQVRAVIEVRMTPERDGGFDTRARRISRFEQVESCYLMSGGYDLNLVVKGKTLFDVARFVSQRLSSIEGVISTSTHFLLKAYKEQGFLIEHDDVNEDRPRASF